jgi:hypothetical protein
MATTTTTTNKPLNPRAQDLSPKGYNRAALYSGKALDFDGVNDYVDLDGFTMTGTTATISFYYKSDLASKTFGYIFDNTQRWLIGQADVANKFGFYDGSTWRYSTQTLTTGEWYHITAVIEGGNVEFLWNGQSVGDTFTGVNSISWASLITFKLGWQYNASGGGQLYGQIAGFKIFNTALTAAQVADLYLNPEKIVPDGVADSALKLWLPMMEGAGTTAYDGSGNGNHGTINGATWVSGVGAPVAQTALVSWNKGTNLVPYSEQFDNAGWSKTRASVTANAATSPDGYANADAIIADSVNDDHFVGQNISVTNATAYSFSAFLKKGNKNWARLWNTSVGYADFDLTNGVVGTQSSATGSIENFGNGWYRCTILYTASSTSAQTHRIYTLEGDNNKTFAGDGLTTNLYVYGAQLEAVDSLGPYIPTLSTAQTSPVLLPQGLTANKDITGVNAFESARNPYALNLDGASWAEVHDNASLDITDAITLEAWVYLGWYGVR